MNEQQRIVAESLSLPELAAAKNVALATGKLIAGMVLSAQNEPQAVEKTAAWLTCLRMMLGKEHLIEPEQLAGIHSQLEALWLVKVGPEATRRGIALPAEVTKRLNELSA